MKAGEAVMLKEAIHEIIHWVHERQAGPVGANVLISPDRPGFVLELRFPKIELSTEEAEFFGRETQLYSMNGTTPKSFLELEKAQKTFREVGTQVAITKLGDQGMSLQLFIPTDETNPPEALAKIRLLERELRGALHQN